MLNDDGVTRWRQIGAALTAEIEQGTLAADRRLPSSTALAARFGVNRHTVLRAIAHLQAQGLVRIERGRGAYAVVNPLQYRIGARQWFEQNLLESQLSPTRRVIAVVEMTASDDVARELAIAAGDPIARVALLGEADGQPVNFNHHHFPLARLPAIGDVFRAFGSAPTDKLSFSAIFRGFGVPDWRRRSVRIRSRPPTDQEVRHLKMAPSDHVLVTDVTSVDGAGVPLVHASTSFCASRVELTLDFSATGAS
jgi:GntR family phosphonate transport system transcriptional regulator